ncbi:MAG: TetR/AcrR family transcriptional regulator [Actinomycetota bacterium]
MTSSPASTDSSGPTTRGHKKKERTRRQLLDAAIAVIAERGEAFTASDVTTRAEMSAGTFYNYFDDRDQLIQAVVPDVIDAFAADSDVTVDEPDPARRFAVITARALHRAVDSPDEFRALLRLDAAQRLIVDGAPMRFLRADIATGVAAGRFSLDVDDAAVDVVVGSILFAARRIVSEPVADGYITRVLSQLLRSLGVAEDEAAQIAATSVTQR